jgi:hypothetical protein
MNAPEEMDAPISRQSGRRILHRVIGGLWALAAAACCLAGANVVVLLQAHSYDINLGPLHLVAHQVFKPLLLVAAAFWVAIVLRGLLPQMPEPIRAPGPVEPAAITSVIAVAIVLAVYAAIYLPSATINVSDPGWTVNEVTSPLRSLPAAIVALFTSPQTDGFYRPLTLLSLWVDDRWFGPALWAHHLQNIVLHVINAALVYKLAREFRFKGRAAFWSAAWFLLACADFEPILWPGARFDLFATTFVLISIIWFLRYAKTPGAAGLDLSISAGAYVLAILNKESGYSVPLVLAMLVLTKGEWQLSFLDGRKVWRSAAVFAAVTAVMLAIRIAIYHGLGGYPALVSGGTSPHFSLTGKSFLGIITRVIPIPLLGLNLSVPLSAAMAGFVILYVAAIVWAVVRRASAAKPERVLVLLALLSALPAINLTGWIDESMRYSRYLYLPGIFILMAVAVLLARRPYGNVVLAALVAANAAGCAHNLAVYRSTIAEAHAISQQIAEDSGRYHAVVVDLTSVDSYPFGVIFFRSEIAARLHAAQPGVCIRIDSPVCEAGQPALRYEWSRDSGAKVVYLPEGLPAR